MAQIVIDSNSNLIQGDFDSATVNDRTKFQTSTPNANTGVYAVPNGSGTVAGFQASNNSNPTNASKIVMATNGSTDTQIISGVNGSGSYLPLSFYTNNALAGQFTTAGNLTVTGTVAGAAGTIYPIVSGTSQASTSGTTITFTGIPSWAKQVTMLFSGVSLTGTDNFLVQIGSGSLTTSGYSNVTGYSGASTGTITSSSGISIVSGGNAGDLTYGQVTFYNITGNTWVASGATTAGTAINYFSVPGGLVSLSGALDRIRVTTVIGSDTFDAGTINILYE